MTESHANGETAAVDDGPIPLRFTGVRRNGASVIGSTLDRPAAFVERCYRLRYKWLTVTRDGEIVGEITFDGAAKKRAWWAEA